jgi:hypothetical protein
MIGRREFITLLGGGRLRQGRNSQTMPMIGFLRSSSLGGAEHLWRRSGRV